MGSLGLARVAVREALYSCCGCGQSQAAALLRRGCTGGGTCGRLFITVRVHRAVLPPRGFGHPEFPRIPSCWGKCPGMLPSSCETPVPLRLSNGTCFSFVPLAPAVGTCSQVLLFCFPSIQHTMHCVSALLVRITRAGYLAVLGSYSLPSLTPLLPPGSWGQGFAWVPLGLSLCLTPFMR